MDPSNVSLVRHVKFQKCKFNQAMDVPLFVGQSLILNIMTTIFLLSVWN